MTSVVEIKLCLLGDSGVGKSSIVHRFVYDEFKPALGSTIGAAFLTKLMVLDGKTYKFQVWDTAGQEKYRALAPMYYRGAAAAIVVYDISDERSFKSMKTWVTELRKQASPDIVLAIAGNKCDLPDDMKEVSYNDATQYAAASGTVCIETSAKTAANVPALFLEIGKRLSQRPSSTQRSASAQNTVVLQRESPHKKKKEKCC